MNDFIALIVDVPNQFFNDVFKGHNALCSAVLVNNHCHVRLGTLHFFQAVTDGFCRWNINDILQDFRNRMEHTMLQPEKVPTGNHANDVIHALFIDWESGKMAVQEHFTDFIGGRFAGNANNLHSWNQNVVDGSFIKLQRRQDQIAFLLFQDTLFFDFINDVLQFVFGHAGSFCFRLQCPG